MKVSLGNLSKKLKAEKEVWEYSAMAERLLSMCKVLGSVFNITKKAQVNNLLSAWCLVVPGVMDVPSVPLTSELKYTQQLRELKLYIF